VRKYFFLSAAALIVVAGRGQTPPSPTFEVVSIKPAAPCCAPGQWRESKVYEERIDFRYVTLKYCMAFAYGMKEYQVSGPSWIGDVHYDIVAKGPEGTRRAQLPEMMQALLRDRLKLAAHHEQKEFSVYALVVGKSGPKLKESSKEDSALEHAAFGMSMSGNGVGRMEARHADMTSLVNTLPRLVGRPVVDLTGITGRYDFELEFSPQDATAMAAPPPPGNGPPSTEVAASIFSSILRIGLRLDSQKRPLDAVVVDSAEKIPTEN
jgi:uncharacterized protein (TIGR03435 family)